MDISHKEFNIILNEFSKLLDLSLDINSFTSLSDKIYVADKSLIISKTLLIELDIYSRKILEEEEYINDKIMINDLLKGIYTIKPHARTFINYLLGIT